MEPTTMFHGRGNSDIVDQVKNLRLAKITAVNLDDMVVDIEFLEESSGKTRVPIPMPSVYPGGGVFSVPKKGALVIVGLRSMQVPVILAYYPFNAFSPDSFYAISKQVFGIPDDLSEGDVFIRSASDSSKCIVCGVTSSNSAFEANIDPTELVERCPNCNAPAYVNDENGRIKVLNKKQLGATFHMRSDGQIFIQGDNLASASNGDTERLLKIVINSVTGDITVQDAGDFIVNANGNAALDCKSLTITSNSKIEEGAASRSQQISGDSTESALNRTIQAKDTLSLAGNDISVKALSSITQESAGRSIVIGNTDTYVTGDLNATIQKNRVVRVLGDDVETVTMSKSVTVGTTLTVSVSGGSTVSIGGAEVVSVTGDSTVTVGGDHSFSVVGASSVVVGGAYSLQATGAASITSASTTDIAGSIVRFNAGVLAVARVTDTTLSNAASDGQYWAFIGNLVAFLTTFAVDSTPFVASQAAAAVAAASIPFGITSKITSGNTTVKA